jgi:uncharacterized membrane protein
VTNRLRHPWRALTGSLWFVPVMMNVGAVLLAVVMVSLSHVADRETLVRWPRVFGADADSSREMLATIAAAMMTVAGITFSITMLAVSQASNQYTPRILRNFMADRVNQFTLGTFTGIFVYCLVVIRTIRGDEELRFIPAIAVLAAFALAILGIGVLVLFVHHVAASLQASTILARVRDETIHAVDRLFPEPVGDEAADAERHPTAVAWTPVPARRTGYIAGLDADALLHFARRCDTVVRMERGIGEHVVAGSPLVSLAGHVPDAEASLDALYDIAPFRTVHQDAAFGIGQMVDIAVKALSPGVNATSTALAAIDALSAVLARLADRRVEERVRAWDGAARVVTRGPTFESLVRDAVGEVRRNGAGNVPVLVRLLQALETVAERTGSPARRRVVEAHGRLVLATAERSIRDAEDLAEVREAYAALTARLQPGRSR